MRADVEVKTGRRLGEFFIKPIQDAKQRLWIMSPWLSAHHVPLLLEKKAKGIDLKVITTDDYTPTHREALRALIESKKETIRPGNRTAKWIGIILIIIGIVLAVPTAGVGLILSFAGYILYIRIGKEKITIRWISKIGDENLLIYHTDPFRPIHAKVYVADDQVALGSANLTKGGAEENLESLAWIKSAEIANRMIHELSSLEKEFRLQRIPVDEVGRAIWQVPVYRRRRF